MPTLPRVLVYPVRAFDPVSVVAARLIAAGSLALDRRYAMFDADGDDGNGKNEPRVHHLESAFDPDSGTLRLRERGTDDWAAVDPDDDRTPLEDWSSDFFGDEIDVRRDDEQGYPDDTDAGGPTLISTGTLAEIASWFDFGPDEARRRFRPNLVVDAPAFWEDRLYADRDSAVSFSVGGVDFDGVNPCQRCVVPTRNPDTGKATDGFQARFVEPREAPLPEWVNRDWYDHFYRVMINTRVPGAPATLAVDDRVEAEPTPDTADCDSNGPTVSSGSSPSSVPDSAAAAIGDIPHVAIPNPAPVKLRLRRV